MTLALLLAAGSARAQDAATAATAALPGSPVPPGVGLSPEAPHAAPAAGGRAPSFGAPVKKDAWAFTLGGSIFGWATVGIGSKPSLSAPNSVSHPLHVPAVIEGRQPFGSNTGGSLFMQYGNSLISGTVNAAFSATGKERQGFYNAVNGASMSAAYLTLNPPLGALTLQLRVGAFTEAFAGPGQWGWGLFGPMLATRGYGFSATSQYPITDSLLMNAELGFQGVPGVAENFVRGEYTGWLETGINSMVAHAHWGLVYKNQYTARLHYAHAWGFDERRFLETQGARDGSMDAALLETRYVASPFGQLGLSFAFWDFEDADHVHDAIWWGLDYTKGGSDMLSKFLGLGGAPSGFCNPLADANGVVIGEPFLCTGDATRDGTPVRDENGTGKLFAISAEYDTSIAQLLWHPRPFTGQAPDLRVAAAATAHWTLDTGDPAFKGASGFMAALQLEYQMLSWFSMPLRVFGEDRDSQFGRYRVYSISPGLAFRTNWQSTDRIELVYTRRFYSQVVDDNPARPLDRNVLALGAYINF